MQTCPRARYTVHFTVYRFYFSISCKCTWVYTYKFSFRCLVRPYLRGFLKKIFSTDEIRSRFSLTVKFTFTILIISNSILAISLRWLFSAIHHKSADLETYNEHTWTYRHTYIIRWTVQIQYRRYLYNMGYWCRTKFGTYIYTWVDDLL